MSLQRYLFLLIACFILLIAGVQFFLIEQVRAQVNKEITNKSQTISEVAVAGINDRIQNKLADLAVQFNKDNERNYKTIDSLDTLLIDKQTLPVQKKRIKINIENTPNATVKIDPELIMTTGDNTKTVTVEVVPNMVPSDANRIFEFVDANRQENTFFAIQAQESVYAVNFMGDDENSSIQKIISFDPSASSVDEYFDRLIWLLLLIAVIGLAFAFLLAKHISKPLSQLNQGFTFLKQGDFNSQLKPEGIKEIRETLSKFNQTSQRLSELQNLEKQFQQQQQMAELGEVARGLAHTLRNPLNTIGLGISQLQRPEIDSVEKHQIAQHIQDKIQHLDNTIKSLLQLANTEVVRSQRLNLVPVVSDILLEVSVTHSSKIEFIHDTPVLLKCAEVEIRAIFHALISNAVEAQLLASKEETGLDQIQKPIVVELKQTQSAIYLRVTDDGLGIDKQIEKDLFKPHVSNKAEGAGMGLFIVKRISELYYKGSLSLSNIGDRGCLAELTLHDANVNEAPTNDAEYTNNDK
ncbi:HAMP domain-containing sensor histidine kinase [Glaciecola petra]|uniref:histidine kinase n=1 Tax=Glaciecola petra TaxID=3075602 RepID=A0ABU2ZVH6_9ALTE|nr:HAMP domain-containing sensor histidine kinase [Aestuariibacter sp. P117]MDT0596656.1 HAMP domain-containing sensor histidine kinase [Aestuariibacter sp. P117]